MEQKESTQAIFYRLNKYTNTNCHKKQTPGMTSTIGRGQDQQSKEYKPQKCASSCIEQRHLYLGRLALFRTQLTNILARYDLKGTHCIPRYSPRVRFATASA